MEHTIYIEFSPVKCKITSELSEDVKDLLYNTLAYRNSGYFFSPKFQSGVWDGYTHLFSKKTQLFRPGLLYRVIDILNNEGLDPVVVNMPLATLYIKRSNTYDLRPYQIEAVQKILQYRFGIIQSPPRSGKAQPLYSLIRTPNGWIEMRDIKKGDIVSTPDGKTAKVTGVFPQGIRPTYKITLEDGRSADCDEEHLWKIFNRRYWHSNNERILSTKEIIDLKNRSKIQLYIPLCDPIENPSRDLPIDPYVLGLLIGDGSIINNISFSNIDSDTINNFKNKLIPDYILKKNKGTNVDYRVVLKNKKPTSGKKGKYTNEYIIALSELGLYGKHAWEKFIPTIYKEASIEQRLELLRGLMDTDGAGDNTSIKGLKYKVERAGSTPYLGTSSYQLALDVQYIVRSLGGLCKITVKHPTFTYKGLKKKGRTAYRCLIRYPKPEDLFKLSRKQENVKRNKNVILRGEIKKVEYLGMQETQCIKIDHPDQLYITNDFIVTHNTHMALAAIDSERKFPTVILCRSLDLAYQTVARAKEFIPAIKVGFVGDGVSMLGDLNVITVQSAYAAFNLKYKTDKGETKERPLTEAKESVQALFDAAQQVYYDEAHESAGRTSRIILDKCKNANLKIGLSATPFEEEDEEALRVEEFVGPVIHKISFSELIKEGFLLAPTIYLYKLPRMKVDGNYQSVYKQAVTDNEFLSGLVKKIVDTLTSLGHSVVVQTEFREQSKKLAKELGYPFLIGNEPAEKRQVLMKKLDDKEILCLVSTLIEQGIDIPSLNFTINLVGGSKMIPTIQRIRSMTADKGKSVCGVIDFEFQCKYLKKHSNRRKTFYQSEHEFKLIYRDVSKKSLEEIV